MCAIFLAFVFSLSAISANAALPPDLQELLQTLPQKKLGLDVVLGRAVSSSDSYRAIIAQKIAADVPELQSKAPLDFRIYGVAQTTTDKFEPQSPFQATQTINRQGSFGISKAFSTGTSLAFDFSQARTKFEFPAAITRGFGGGSTQGQNGAPAGTGDDDTSSTGIRDDFYESRGILSLSQNLWKDAFGHATRKGIEAGKIRSEANELAIRDNIEDWSLGLIDAFYGAWLAQSRRGAAADGMQRKERLLGITRLKLKRGTAETQDLLQAQSAFLASGVQLNSAQQVLGNRWRSLVISLKLPEHWMSVDPSEIPMILDSPLEAALSLCGSEQSVSTPPQRSIGVQWAKLMAESAQLYSDQARNMLWPDLELRGAVGANGIIDNDDGAGEAFQEFYKREHPMWRVGVQVTMPLGFYAERAAIRNAEANLIRSEAQASQEEDNFKVNWASACTNLHRARKSTLSLKEAYENQKQRADIEENRFKIGRSQMLQVIQAGDDATMAELTFRESEVEVRNAAWRVRRLANQIQSYLENLQGASKS